MSSPGRILVADDEAVIAEFVSLALSQEGYEVMTASGGQDALRLVEQSPPDIILLDVLMPDLDGWGFMRAYRQTPAPHAPIILITATPDGASQAESLGCAGCLQKPFDLAALLSTVQKGLSGR